MCLYARAQRPEPSGPVLSGIVADTADTPIAGATITIKTNAAKIITDSRGRFSLRATSRSGTLIITHLGYQTIYEKFDEKAGPFNLTLIPVGNMLEEVEVSTGYQTLRSENGQTLDTLNGHRTGDGSWCLCSMRPDALRKAIANEAGICPR